MFLVRECINHEGNWSETGCDDSDTIVNRYKTYNYKILYGCICEKYQPKITYKILFIGSCLYIYIG